ncbi:MAG: hypothetical protein IBJ03_02500 [Gemmatimonadaceae bacterium]|nr:hypothetical protein [Gemmatimonadaceae bacterium]
MTTVLRRIRGILGTALTWAVAWAFGGLLIGVSSLVFPFLPWDGFFRVFDAPLPAMGVPGFFAGAFYAAIVGVVARRKRFHELSMRSVAIWGALGGALLAALPALMVLTDTARIAEYGLGIWKHAAIIFTPVVLFSTASATGSLLIARRAQSAELLAVDDADLLESPTSNYRTVGSTACAVQITRPRTGSTGSEPPSNQAAQSTTPPVH